MSDSNNESDSVFDLFGQVRDQIVSICRDPAYTAALKSSLAETKWEQFETTLQRLEQEEIYIAVLGVQGVGKSTLLNALLFNERVLPVDVTETTAILVKVHSSDGGESRAEVLLDDGRRQVCRMDSDALAEFVHNEFNPKNEKRVRELHCYHESPLLKKGFCFVDTPGVESLSAENGLLTLNFLPQITAALFVTMTTPVLTASEVYFLKGARGHFGQFFFVQNVWGEDTKNVEEATEVIRRTLVEIESEEPMDKRSGADLKQRIFPVDIHGAMDAKSNGDDAGLQASGLPDLSKALAGFLKHGPLQLTLKLFLEMLERIVEEGLRSLRIRRKALDEEGSDFIKRLKAKERTVQSRLDELYDKWRDEEGEFNRRVRDACRTVIDGLSTGLWDLSQRLINEVENGDLSVEQLEKSFGKRMETELRLHFMTFQLEISDAVRAIEKAFRETFEGIGEARVEVAAELDPQTLQDAELREMGHDVMKVPAWLGGVGIGILVGEALLALINGATLAAAVGGPIGWIISGTLLGIGIILKKWFKEKAVRKLREAVETGVTNARDQINQQIRSFEKSLEDLATRMEEAVDEQIEQLRFELSSIREEAYASHEQKETRSAELRQAEAKLDELRSLVREETTKCLRLL